LTTSPSGTLGAFLAFWSQGCSGRQEKKMKLIICSEKSSTYLEQVMFMLKLCG